MIVIGVFAKEYWSGFARELGSLGAKGITSRRDERQRRKAARRAAITGATPAAILAAAGGDLSPETVDRILVLQRRAPAVTALITATSTAGGPLNGRIPIVIGIGPTSTSMVASAVADRQLGAAVGFAVQMGAAEPRPGVVHADGDLWMQLAAAMRWADEAPGDFVAVLLNTPVSGSWAGDRDLDLSRLFGILFADRTRTTWLSYNEPLDPSAWPSEVIIELPIPLDDAFRLLKAAGLPVPAIHRSVSARSMLLSAEDALSFLMTVTSGTDAVAGDDVVGALPPYSAAIALALEPATQSGAGHISRDAAVARDIEDFLTASRVRVLALQQGNPTILPLNVYRGQVTAWQVATQAAISIGQGQQVVDAAPVGWLREAITAEDEPVAAAILATHGRAWIETTDPIRAVDPIRQAMLTFPAHTRAHLWARFLLALDSALRLDDPHKEWFDTKWCQLAGATELGPLFMAERMEFSRLRGELLETCEQATKLTRLLQSCASPATPEEAYALGTAHFVVANVLRRGGRYAVAQDYIDTAVEMLDPNVPSHRIELVHCRYATSVCESMQGLATVNSSQEWPAGQAMFGRSLVTLANSHAAWFIRDYVRAVGFADEARKGFEEIGYTRYAKRAADLTQLLAQWARLAKVPVVTAAGEENAVVNALLTPESQIELFANMRPSRALSLLQFAVTFGSSPDEARVVILPQYMALDSDGSFTLARPLPAASLREAELMLRQVMGIGAETRVPLAAD